MSSEDFRHAPGWVKTGEGIGPHGERIELGHVAGVTVHELGKRYGDFAVDKAQPLSAGNSAALSALQEEREKMQSDSRRLDAMIQHSWKLVYMPSHKDGPWHVWKPGDPNTARVHVATAETPRAAIDAAIATAVTPRSSEPAADRGLGSEKEKHNV